MKTVTKIEPTTNRHAVKKTRVAAYCRVSTGAYDQLLSLETQKAHYEELIKSVPDWEFAGLYYDEGISGTTKEKRPALQRLIFDCENGKIDRVMTKSISRFARNTADCLELTRKLLNLGITIFFEKENIDTGSMESELLLSIMSSLAEGESVSISENEKWGVQHQFKNGTFKIRYAPYGYDVREGKLFIKEEEAKWVRWIYTQALNGVTCGTIAKMLNEKQVPSKKKGTWTATTVQAMLTNEKYVGDCLFQKTFSDSSYKRHLNHGERDQFYIEDHHDAIVSREDFKAVNALLQQHALEKNIRRGDGRFQNRYPFTGKIVCGECGSTFKRHVNSTGTLKYPVWVCKRHLTEVESCSMKYIRECDLECAFTTMINKVIFAKEGILNNLTNALRNEPNEENIRRINQIEQKLENNSEQRQTLTTIMAQGYLEQALYIKENNVLIAEADALNAEKERLEKEASGRIHEVEALKDFISYVAHAKAGPSFDGELVYRFLDYATIVARNVIVFHLKCGLNLTERIGIQ